MIRNFTRKVRQVAGDPVLRKWLLGRLLGRLAAPPAFAAHRPPYLNGMAGADGGDLAPPEPFSPLDAAAPSESLDLPLPGLRLRLEPGTNDVFARNYADIETLLALHRFAWVPLAGNGEVTSSWVQVLWDQWRQAFAKPDDGWAWHPYTAAERVVNLLDLGRRRGLPEPVDETVRLLALHGQAILDQLEYFGDHDTSNHLSNNGRGLYRLGLALGLAWAADAGARILEQEAARIFMPSGVLREGSSHYHLLIVRNYADAWLAARRHKRPEEPALRDVTAKALSVVPWLILPGGFPLVGDVSPDCPPSHLLGFVGTDSGWVKSLDRDSKAVLLSLIDETRPAKMDEFAADGWLRFAHGPWSGLWHAAPGGWPHAPGHGHQDAGGFELHFKDTPVFVDPGRGAYGETGDAALYRSAAVHNTLTVDDTDPYPANKPYYDDAFRQAVAGPPPRMRGGGDEVTLDHRGFQRLGGVGGLRRRWRFTDNAMVLTDDLKGVGRRRVTRRFVTPLEAEPGAGGVALTGAGRTFHLSAPDASAAVTKTTLWQAYDAGRPGYMIAFTEETPLPWSGEIRLAVI